MILIKRISDNAIMNDRQMSNFGMLDKLNNLIVQRDELPANTMPDVVERINHSIDVLQAGKTLWETRRKEAVVKMFGGSVESYTLVTVPDGEEYEAMTARHIEEVDGVLTYNSLPEYQVDGSVVTVNQGWVRGNDRLFAADVTDFGELSLTEPLYFALIYAVSDATQAISVQLLTRAEDEEFGALPANLTQIRVICEGRVNVDNTITLSEVI